MEDCPQNHDPDQVYPSVAKAIAMLTKLANSWEERAQVRQFDLHHNIQFQEDTDDYIVDLLPFKEHPFFLNASEKMHRKILSCGWLIYNQKTLLIETEIIQPTIKMILAETIPGVTNYTIKQIANETLIDEAFHTLLVSNAMYITAARRNLYLKFSDFNLIKNMRALQDKYSEHWKKRLIQLATAIISEIFISDYLKLLSENENIQPINRLSVAAHRQDELAHNHIFQSILHCIYAKLSQREKSFFSEIFAKPVRWFADLELGIWQASLEQVGFQSSAIMLNDCQFLEANLYYFKTKDMISLANNLGIELEAFYQEGFTSPKAQAEVGIK